MLTLRTARIVPILSALFFFSEGTAVRAQNPAPAAPPTPAAILFPDQVAGRQLLFAARDAYRAAPTVRFSAAWTLRSEATTTGTESIAAEKGARRLSLTTESGTGGAKQIRRAIANGETLLATRYQAKPADKSPLREYVRLTLSPEDTLSRALSLVQAAPVTQAGVLLLDPRWTVRGMAWRGKRQTVGGIAADEVWETMTEQRQGAGSRRTPTAVKRRYLIDTKTRLLVRFEEWADTAGAGGSRRNAAARTTYRREDYSGSRLAAPLSATLFAQTLPAGYTETALPSVTLPPPGGPKEADPEARRLLARWESAQDRALSYFAQVEVTTRQVSDSPDAPPARTRGIGDGRILYTAWLYKPGRARLTQETTGVPDRWSRSLLAVANGQQVSVEDRRRNRVRTVPLPDPAEMGARIQQAGFNDWAGTLNWLFTPPNQVYERATYRGRQNLGGETVDVLELVQSTSERAGRDRIAQVTATTTVALGQDGLPRMTERRTARSLTEVMERDQPADTIITARYRQVQVNAEPPAGTFAYKPPADAATNNRGRRNERGG